MFKLFGCLGKVAIGLVVLAVIGAIVGKDRPKEPASAPAPIAQRIEAPPPVELFPEVAAFLDDHPEFGTPTGRVIVPDWARGKRQGVRFDSGRSLLFYLKNGEVLTVYDADPAAGRTIVWGDMDRDPAPATAKDHPPVEPEAVAGDAEPKPGEPSARYQAELKRTAERKRARAAAGARRNAAANIAVGQQLQATVDAMSQSGSGGRVMGPGGATHTGPRGGQYHISPNGNKVYDPR